MSFTSRSWGAVENVHSMTAVPPVLKFRLSWKWPGPFIEDVSMMSYVPPCPNPASRTSVPPSKRRKYQWSSAVNSIPAAPFPKGSLDGMGAWQSYQVPRRRCRSSSAEGSVLVTPEGSRAHPWGPRQTPDVGSVVVVVVTHVGIVLGVTLHIVDPFLQSPSNSLLQKRSRKP